MRLPKYFYNLNEAEQAEWVKAERSRRARYIAKYRANNPEKEKAIKARYIAKYPEKEKAKRAKYRANNPEKEKARNIKTKRRVRAQKDATKFFQMTQSVSEIANINTEKK